jgi:hypothetical protein
MNFAHVGKRRIGLERSTPRPLDDLERKLTSSRRDHDERPPLIRRVGLVVAPAAERHQLAQVEVQPHYERLTIWWTSSAANRENR